MLVLSRGIGESIFIGDAISLTVYDKLRYHVVLAVLSREEFPVTVDQTPLQPAVFRGGERFYLTALRAGETVHIDETAVTVAFHTGDTDSDETPLRQVRLCLDAPKDLAIHREEIYRRILREHGEVPPVSPAAWIEKMNTPDFRLPHGRMRVGNHRENS